MIVVYSCFGMLGAIISCRMCPCPYFCSSCFSVLAGTQTGIASSTFCSQLLISFIRFLPDVFAGLRYQVRFTCFGP